MSSWMARSSTPGNLASVVLRALLMRAGKARLVRGLPCGPPAVDVQASAKPVSFFVSFFNFSSHGRVDLAPECPSRQSIIIFRKISAIRLKMVCCMPLSSHKKVPYSKEKATIACFLSWSSSRLFPGVQGIGLGKKPCFVGFNRWSNGKASRQLCEVKLRS